MENKLNKLLNEIFSVFDSYGYTIDYTNKKIVIFVNDYIIELIVNKPKYYYKKTNYFYIKYIEFDIINNLYNFINNSENNKEFNFKKFIYIIEKYEKIIYNLLINSLLLDYKNSFKKIQTSKRVIFVANYEWGFENKIENGLLSFCSYSDIELIFIYKFGKNNYTENFDEFIVNYPKVNFIRNEKFDDNFLKNYIGDEDVIISLGYDCKIENKNLHLIILHENGDNFHGNYNNIFSFYKSNYVGHSKTKYINYKKLYQFLNPQDTFLINNFNILNKIDDFYFTGGMSSSRNFNLLSDLNLNHKGLLLSDKDYDLANVLSVGVIKYYYAFLFLFRLCSFTIHIHTKDSNTDDKTRMISTSLALGKPLIIPYNDGKIVKEVVENNLGLVYELGNIDDLKLKVNLFLNNKELLKEYSYNCIKYSEKNININKFMNFMFLKIL